MNWAEIRQLYISSCQEAAEAAATWDTHVNEGYKRVCARVDVRELETTDETISTTADQDYVALPTNVFSIIQVDDVTNAQRIQPEPDGMRGRSQYLDADNPTRPAPGKPLYYKPTGQRMYLRPTPDDTYSLRIRYKQHPPTVDETQLDEFPMLPEHLHVAVVYASAISFFDTHPDANKAVPEVGATYSLMLQQSLDTRIKEPFLPKERERFDQSGRSYIPGFSRFRTW